MTTLFIDYGISINLADYMRDPVSVFKNQPPMFVTSSVGERLAIAVFTEHSDVSSAITQWMNSNLSDRQQARVARKYAETMQGLFRANPNGWAK